MKKYQKKKYKLGRKRGKKQMKDGKKKNQNLRLPFTPQLPTLSTTIMGTRQHHLQLASSWQLPYPIKTCPVPAKAPWSYRWSLRPPPLHLLLQPSLVTNPLTRTFIADHHELRQPSNRPISSAITLFWSWEAKLSFRHDRP